MLFPNEHCVQLLKSNFQSHVNTASNNIYSISEKNSVSIVCGFSLLLWWVANNESFLRNIHNISCGT